MGHNETSKYPIPSISFPIDIKKYGKGVAFGGVAKDDNIMDVNFKARFNQGQKMWRTDNTSNTNMWHYLGQFQINEQGNYVHIKIFGGDGQNAGTYQNMLMDIIMKKGWQSTPSTSNYVGVTYTVYTMNHDKYRNVGSDIKVKVMCHTVGYADVYVYFSWAYSTIRYTVDGEFDSFIRGTQSESSSEPTEGVEQPCIGGVVPIIYNGDLLVNRSFRIPKNGDQGYGLCNSDGVSIIRDFNNRNVTVDATGGELFLGFQNTTSINILNGKALIDGNFIQLNNNTRVYGWFDVNNNIRSYSGDIWTDSGSIRCNTVDGSGKGCRMESNGNLTVCGSIYNNFGSMRFKHIYDADLLSNAPNMYITSNGWFRRTTNTSLLAHKKDIKNVENEELNPEKLYDLEVKQFKYKDDYQPSEYDIRYGKDLIGFIAEDVEKIYPVAVDYEYDVDHDDDENINDYEKDTVKNVKRTLINWNERYLIPPILKLTQNHKKEIDDLKVKMAALEQRLAALENKGGN